MILIDHHEYLQTRYKFLVSIWQLFVFAKFLPWININQDQYIQKLDHFSQLHLYHSESERITQANFLNRCYMHNTTVVHLTEETFYIFF